MLRKKSKARLLAERSHREIEERWRKETNTGSFSCGFLDAEVECVFDDEPRCRICIGKGALARRMLWL